MQTLYLVAILGWIAYQTTAQPKWKLEFENSANTTGNVDPPEIRVKALEQTEEGIITGKNFINHKKTLGKIVGLLGLILTVI